MRRFALILALLGGQVAAEDWHPMTGPQIREALSGRMLAYGAAARQEFRKSGRTLYDAGSPSWGRWAVRDDQYCSCWPPSDLWTCYDVARRGDSLRFIDQNGEFTDGTYAN